MRWRPHPRGRPFRRFCSERRMSRRDDPDQRPHRHRRCGVRRHGGACATAASPRSPTAARRCRRPIDLEGDYLVPGLVELHTDNMEKHFAPRPGVQVAEPVGGDGARHPDRRRRHHHGVRFAVAGRRARRHRPRAEPRAHGRCGLCRERAPACCAPSTACICAARSRADDAVEAVERWIDLPLVGLISINDHTPGQRQFLDPEKLRQYYRASTA